MRLPLTLIRIRLEVRQSEMLERRSAVVSEYQNEAKWPPEFYIRQTARFHREEKRIVISIRVEDGSLLGQL